MLLAKPARERLESALYTPGIYNIYVQCIQVRAQGRFSALAVLCHYKLQTYRSRSNGTEPSVLIEAELRFNRVVANHSESDMVSDVNV